MIPKTIVSTTQTINTHNFLFLFQVTETKYLKMMALSSIHRSKEAWESELCLPHRDDHLLRRSSCLPASSTGDDFRRNSCLPGITPAPYKTKRKSGSEKLALLANAETTDSLASLGGQQMSEIDDVIIINVSGKIFETYVKTLQRFPNTLLGDPTRLLQFYNHVTGEYFFDRHRKAFNGILYFYQSNGLVEKPLGVSEGLFTQEALFFGLSHAALQYEESVASDDGEFVLPSNPYLCKIWVAFEHPTSSLAARILAVISIIIVLVSIVVFCVESIPDVNPEKPEGKHMYKTWMIINSICNAWFTIEYVLRLISSPAKILFLRSSINIIDLISILPFYISILVGPGDGRGGGLKVLKVIRIFRVTKIFKLTRHSRGLYVLAKSIKSSQHEISMLVLFMAIGIILFSSAMFYAESAQNEKFKSIPACFWWAVVTMTTVGYGDLYPTTVLGKFIGAICAVSGVLVIALPVPVFVSNFEHCYKQVRRL